MLHLLEARAPAQTLAVRLEGRHYETARRALLCASARAGIGKVVTPHMLRHSFATNLLEHGTDLRKIQVGLSHGSIKSTTIDTQVSPEQVASVRSHLEDLTM